MAPLPPPPPAPFPVNPPSDPPGNAALFLDEVFTKVDDLWTLVYHRGQYLHYTGIYWKIIAPDELEQKVSWFFENAVFPFTPAATRANPNPVTIMKKFVVNNGSLGDLMRALRNKVIIQEEINVNSWILPRPGDPETDTLIPLRNGILSTTTRQVGPATPRFFNTYSLSFDYDPSASAPSSFYAFLRSVFENDQDRHMLVQEMIGYILTPRMDQQKMFCLTGPPRSGKGTMARLVEQLVGPENYGSTSLSTLGSAHGLEDIVTKPVVVLGDAVAVGKQGGVALENLLGIIGEDKMAVNPKGRKMYSAKMPCRFILLANNLPDLPDRAQALRARWMHLRFTRSFAGMEDRMLDEKLRSELPGIFNWALDGLDRLKLRGEFIQPEVGLEDLDMLTRMVSPETSFVEDCCEVGDFEADITMREITDDLYLAWCNYAYENGVERHAIGSKVGFGRALRTVRTCGHLKGGKTPRDIDGKQKNATLGIRLTRTARARYVKSDLLFKIEQDTGGGGLPGMGDPTQPSL